MGYLDGKIDASYGDRTIKEIANAPVDALQGVTLEGAKKLREVFNIKTVRDLGTNRYFLWAQAISKLAD